MNIREISDVFKDTVSDIEALKSYNFGWASDRVRQGNAEDFQELNLFPRLFFSVPTVTASNQTRKQDTYQITLFFDDLLGYDNEGETDATLQIDKWASLQQYATAFIQRLNLIKQSILPNYIFIPEPPSFTFDSFVGAQRLITVQVDFTLVVPTNCEVVVKRIINVIGSVIAQGVTESNLFVSRKISASVEGNATVIGNLTIGQNIVEVESSVTSFALASGNIVKVQTISADTLGQATANASIQNILKVVGNVSAIGQVTGNIKLTLFTSSSVQANGNVDANIDVIAQGVSNVEANVIANAISEANIKLTIPISSSSTTQATTSADAKLTKVIEASANASGTIESSAQIIISVNAFATATAQTNSNATLSYSVNANALATGQSTAEAKVISIISAEATATANSTAEAGIGVAFVAAGVASGSVITADIIRTATFESSQVATGNTTGTITTAKNVSASVTGAATVTSATLTSEAAIDADATAFFLRVTNAGGTLTSTEQSAVNTLVISMKANGTWTKMLALYPMVGASAASCAQNLKSSSFTGTFTAGWTFASNGATPNGTSAYMNTGLTPSIHLSQNSASLGYYGGTTGISGDTCAIGSIDNASPQSQFALFPAASQGTYLSINDTSDATTNTNAAGFIFGSRTISTNLKISIRGVITTKTTNSVTPNNREVYLGARNFTSGILNYSSSQHRLTFIGDGLTDAEMADYYTSVQSFQTTLSRNV
jgi:hypothetical protein